MAFPVERYVTADAGGLGDGTIGNPWTLAQAIAANVAGDRVNVKSGAYTNAGFTMGTGTTMVPCVYRGYKTTIGDLDSQGRNADGTLNTTDFPTLTMAGVIVPAAFSFIQNFAITASFNGSIFTSATVDNWGLVNCSVSNTGNEINAACVISDAYCFFVNCDFSCTGATHTTVLTSGISVRVIGCTFRITKNDKVTVLCYSGTFYRSVFVGPATPGTSIAIDTGIAAIALTPVSILGCTIYGYGTAIQLRDVDQTGMPVLVVDNIVTDCTNYLVKLVTDATDIATFIEFNQRTRDNTNPRSATIIDVALGREVTTDTGGAETDYVSVTTGDLRLIQSSPARLVGMMPLSDCGAFQSNLSRTRSRPLRITGRSA